MNKNKLSQAIDALRNGDLIVYPTDTLYALGADIYDEVAVGKIFKVKKRPTNIPLSVGVSSFNDISKIAFMTDKAHCLAKRFLPGPFTMILNKKNCISDIVTGGTDKIAVRIPDNEIALDLLSDFGPLTITSANIHNKETFHTIKDIKTQFNAEDISFFVDYGNLSGLASTIVDITGELKIIREGVITKKDIQEVI